MYCVKCGVELADSEKVCPLCGTRVFHPDLPQAQGEPPYPPQAQARPEEVSHTGALFVLTVLLALPAVLSILCDWRVNGRIVWSGYSVGGAALLAAAAIFYVVNYPVSVSAAAAARQLPIYSVERSQKVCSISFDAAWGDAKVRQLSI